jgi:hypothetical protein
MKMENKEDCNYGFYLTKSQIEFLQPLLKTYIANPDIKCIIAQIHDTEKGVFFNARMINQDQIKSIRDILTSEAKKHDTV